MLYVSKTLAILSGVLFLASCGDSGDSFSLLADSDDFTQSAGSVNDKVDILWVVDNSGSMSTSQAQLASNFNSFIADFQAKNLNFRMAVTSTDGYKSSLYPSATNCGQFRDGALDWAYRNSAYNCFSINGGTYSGVRTMLPGTPNLSSVFVTNVLQGVNGSGDERPFQSMQVALDDPSNAGFLRNDAFLAVIMITDEDDASHAGTTDRHTSGYNDPNNPNLYSPSSYVSYLDTLTGSGATTKKYNVSAIAIFDDACLTQLGNGRVRGNRIAALADATGGIKSSLCGDFASELDLIASNILSAATEFQLSRVPLVNSIVVKVNGIVVPRVDQNPGPLSGGWEYIVETNSIRFSGDYIPAAGSSISVDFDPAQYGG